MKWFALVFVFLLASCAVPDKHGVEHEETAGDAGDYSIAVHTVPVRVEPGQDTALHVVVTHADGTPVDFELVHERLMHIMIIRDDLQHFAHLHSEDVGFIDLGQGVFTINHEFPEPGKYRVMVEFTEKGITIAQPLDVAVAGDYKPVPLSADFSVGKRFDNYVLQMQREERIVAGKGTVLAFEISQNEIPVTDIDKFLGEKMHLAIWQEGLRYFEHGHPLQGEGIRFHVTFPSPGIYKLYPQFQHKGNVITGEFLIKAE